MIGRESEWAALRTCVEQVCAGTGQLVTLLGEAGIGKSRLVTEMRHHTAHKVFWLESHALSSGHHRSYAPFRDLIRQTAGLTSEEDSEQAHSKLMTRLQTLLPETWEERFPYLLRLAGVPGKRSDEARLQSLPLDALSQQVFRTALQFFARLAGERPVVLVLENWHWRDPASTALLTHVVPLIHRLPMLICLVSRPESPQHIASWREPAGDKLRDILLAPLSSAASAQLLDTLVPHTTLPAEVRTTLLAQAGGNPFFLEELAYALPLHGASARTAFASLPTTIEAHLLARFHEIPEVLKQLLRLAAVLGRRFAAAVLQGTAQLSPSALFEALGTLQRLHFLDVDHFEEQTYQFKHDLIQEALYRNLLPETRKLLHQQVGAYLEATSSDRHEGLASQLAYHYAQAEDWEKARDYLLQAGEQARQVAADAEALQLYQQVLTLCGAHLDQSQWISVHRKMGEALYHRGEFDHADQLLQQALDKARKPMPTTRWGIGWALVGQLCQQASHRVWPPWRHRRGEPEPGSIATDCVRIYECLGWMDYFTGREARLLLDVLRMLNVAEQSGHAVDMARGLAAVGVVGDIIPLVRLAGYYHRRAVTCIAQHRQPLTVGFVYFCLAYHEECWGTWRTAIAHYRRAIDAYWEAGDVRGWASAMTSVTRLSNYQGRFAQGLEVSRRVIPVGQEGADKQVWGWGLLETGWLLERLGAWEEATAHLQQAWSVLEASHRLSAERGLRGIHLIELRKGLAEVALVIAEQATGPARATALRQGKEACAALWKECRYYPGGTPHAYRLQGTYAWLQGKRSVARQWWHRGLRAAEVWGAEWDLGMTHFEMGRRLEDTLHLNRAVTILTGLGVALEIPEGVGRPSKGTDIERHDQGER